MAHPPGISLCMIVKNEQHRIADCLASADQLVDEKVVADTGSTDDTRSLAERNGARVIDYDWDGNTARARNTGIAAARYEWILILDADEKIAQSDFKHLKELTADDSIDGIIFLQRNYINDPDVENWRPCSGSYAEEANFAGYFDVSVIRMFRNRPDIRYTGHAHELVEESMKDRPKRHSHVPIHHYGLAQGRVGTKEKDRHYLSLLLNDYQEQPDTFKPNFLLGRQYYQLDKYDDAVFHLKKAIAIRPDDASALNCMGLAMLRLNKPNEAVGYLKQACVVNPRYEEPYYSLAVAHVQLNDLRKGIEYLRKFLIINPNGVKALNLLGYIYLRQGMYGMAEKQFRAALAIHPRYNIARGNLIKTLINRGDRKAAQIESDILIGYDPNAQGFIASLFSQGG